MAAPYKTPGVYIEEIPKFPPSIAPVETAIPAFIGYTEKAELNGESLFNKARRIESIAEYEFIFGTGPSQNVTVSLDSNNQFVKAEGTAKFFLYDSLRMFYANGGGNCYIISVGDYSKTIAAADITKALGVLEQEDEPTLILAPDVVSDSAGPYSFQQQALSQCNKLQDRFTLCDLTRSTTTDEFKKSVSTFRDSIGLNFLKYGAAYGPWINANLPRTLLRRNLSIVRLGTTLPDILDSLTADTAIKNLMSTIGSVTSTVDGLAAEENTLSGGPANGKRTLDDELTKHRDAYLNLTDTSNASLQGALQSLMSFYISILKKVRDYETTAPDPASTLFKIKSDLEKYRNNSNLTPTLKTIAGHHKALFAESSNPKITLLANDDLAKFLGFADTAAMLADSSIPDVSGSYSGTDKNKADTAFNTLTTNSATILNSFRFYAQTVKSYESTLNQALVESFGFYKTLVQKAAEALNLLPPSGAIAGIYAATDRDRGVWKAPANVSLSNVIEPGVKISHEQQGEYNVDVNSGKSINIIRSFPGKGTLVWGARTLAGNDNEWRYVPVRRFFIFVEESVKKATEQFVFEPNDANTWVKVQAMIENFLTTLWRQGAMQGIKPEHAFYVSVGLGKTMTALDILEGRMIIEIGMAAVRPAEFIILKFSHKMAES